MVQNHESLRSKASKGVVEPVLEKKLSPGLTTQIRNNLQSSALKHVLGRLLLSYASHSGFMIPCFIILVFLFAY